MHTALAPGGVVVLNVASRAAAIYDSVLKAIKTEFPVVYVVPPTVSKSGYSPWAECAHCSLSLLIHFSLSLCYLCFIFLYRQREYVFLHMLACVCHVEKTYRIGGVCLPENVHALEGLVRRARVAPVSSPTLHACGCARPSCACFGHKTVKAVPFIATLCRTLLSAVFPCRMVSTTCCSA